MANASRDQNNVATLLAVSSVDGVTPVVVYADPSTHRLLVDIAGGSGTVTSVSVVTANGFAGTVANPTTTPAITLTTTVSGVLKGNGTAISAATANTDYQVPIVFSTTGSSGAATFDGTNLNIPVYSSGGGGTPGGSSGQVQYNNAGAFGGVSGVTVTGGAALLFAANDLLLSGSSSGTAAINAPATGGGTLTLPPGTDTIAGIAATQTLTNKSIVATQLTGTLQAGQFPALTGDITTTAGALATTLATVNSNTGSFTNANITVNGKGLITAATNGTAGLTTLTVGTTTITSGTNFRVLMDNSGVLGEYATTGTGTVAMSTSPTFITPTLGAATATSINGNVLTTGSSTYTGTAAATYTFPGASATIAGLGTTQTFTGQNKFNNFIDVNNAVTVTSNAGTVPVTFRLNTFTNSSAATMAITMTTTSAVDGQMSIVRIYDFSGVAETIGWTNTENSSVGVPTTSNGSTTLPLTVGFMFNGSTSKWRCVSLA